MWSKCAKRASPSKFVVEKCGKCAPRTSKSYKNYHGFQWAGKTAGRIGAVADHGDLERANEMEAQPGQSIKIPQSGATIKSSWPNPIIP